VHQLAGRDRRREALLHAQRGAAPKKDWSYFFVTVLATSASSYNRANALSAQRVSGRSVRLE